MANYAAQYRQAMADENPDFARNVISSATQAARVGLITPEEVADLMTEVKANPPQ